MKYNICPAWHFVHHIYLESLKKIPAEFDIWTQLNQEIPCNMQSKHGVPEKTFGYGKCSNTLLEAKRRKRYSWVQLSKPYWSLAFDTRATWNYPKTMPRWLFECISMNQYHPSLGSKANAKVLLFHLGAKHCAKIARLPTSTSFVNRPPELPKGRQDPPRKAA